MPDLLQMMGWGGHSFGILLSGAAVPFQILGFLRYVTVV